MKKAGFAFVFFLLATVVLTWPLCLHLGAQVAGPGADTLLNLWIRLWDYHVLAEGRILGLFDANIFFPAPKTLALSEHALSDLIIFGPAYALGGNPLLAYNILFLCSFFLSGIAAFALAYRITRQFGPALIAGFIFAFIPIRFAHLGHIQLLTLFWSPLAFLFLDRYLEKRDWTSLIVFSVCTAMQTWASFYSGYFLVLLLGLYYLLFHIGKRMRPSRRDAFALVLIILMTLPLAYPYLTLKSYFGFTRELSEVEMYSADLGWSFTKPPKTNWLYGTWSGAVGNSEKMLFVGFLPIILCGIAVFRWLRAKPILILTLCGTLLSSVIVALGPVLFWFDVPRFWPLPYRVLYEFVPGFSSMRVPTRVMLISALVIAILSALAVMKRESKTSHGHLVLVSLVLLSLFLEYRNLPLELIALPKADQMAMVYQWLGKQPATCVVLELPAGDPSEDSWYVYCSAFHRKRIVNGYSGFFPGYYHFLVAELARPLTRETMGVFEGTGISHVILHRNRCDPSRWDEAVKQGLVSRVARFGEDDVLALNVPVRYGKLRIRRFAFNFAAPDQTVDAPLVLESEGGVWRKDLKRGIDDVEVTWTDGNLVFRNRSKILLPAAIAGRRIVSLPVTTPSRPGLYQLDVSFANFSQSQKVRVSPWISDIYNGDSFMLSRHPAALSASHREELLHNCMDGDLRSSWMTWQTQAPNMSLQADLLGLVRTGGISLFLGPNITNYPRHLTVETSLDGARWEQVEESGYGVQFSTPKNEKDSLLENVQTILWSPRDVRFIRLHLDAYQPNYWWSIAEMAILGTVLKSERTSIESGDLGGELELLGLQADGQKVRADVRVRNKGRFIWLRSGPKGVGSVRLGARWVTGHGESSEPERFGLPRSLGPGEEITMQVAITPPRERGPHRFRLDLVDEGIAWQPNGVEKEFNW